MATFLYRRPIYYQERGDDIDELGSQEMARSMNEQQTLLEEIRLQVQTNSDAIVFLQEQLKLGTPSGVPVAPTFSITGSTNDTGPVRTFDVNMAWPAIPDLTEIALFWEGTRLVPGPAPTATSYAFNVPLRPDLSYSYTAGMRVSNQFGTSPIATIRV
jgi:hypothetical protein